MSLPEFWEACGGSRELRLLIAHAAQPTRGMVVSTPFAVVGSAEACEICLPSDQVSYRHAYLQVIDGQLWRFDLLSRTGTFWKHRRECAGVFENSDALCIGPYQLQNLENQAAQATAANPLLATPAELDPLPTVTLEFLNAAAESAGAGRPTWQLDRVLTYAGQSRLCKVRLNCPSVSHIHCSMLRTPTGVWVIDLVGRGGIAVNGAAIRWARLRDGDRLRIGRFELLIREDQRRSLAQSRAGSAEPFPAMLHLASDTHSAVSDRRAVPPGPMPTPAEFHSPLATVGNSGTISKLGWPGAIQPTPPALVANDLTVDGANQSLVLTVVQQFSVMQQQMFEQFQQTTMMMLQMFGTLQREQFDLIRQELNGLRDLNQEIHALQTELAKHRATSSHEARTLSAGSMPAIRTGESYSPATNSSQAHRKNGDAGPSDDHQSSPDVKRHAIHNVPDSKSDSAVSGQHANAPGETPARSVAGGSSAPSTDVHAWLSQRFNELEQERQSRWQRIVGALTGK